MRQVDAKECHFTSKNVLVQFEGGVVFQAEADGKFFLILDESTVVSLLDEEDRAGIVAVKYLEFDTLLERAEYEVKRGWSRKA